MTTIVVSIIGAAAVVVGGVLTFKLGMVNSDRARIKALEERVDNLERELRAEREYSASLRDHIYKGKPPPPPQHP